MTTMVNTLQVYDWI